MWLADGPAHVGGRSATLTLFVPERVFSGRAYDLLRGRSVPGVRMVRRLFDNLYQRHCCLCLISRMDCGRSAPWERTVRWLISMLYQRLFVSGVVELLTAHGPPLGRGRSAGALTASSDMHLMHSVSLAYNGGRSGF
jgi:hypothetical protein